MLAGFQCDNQQPNIEEFLIFRAIYDGYNAADVSWTCIKQTLTDVGIKLPQGTNIAGKNPISENMLRKLLVQHLIHKDKLDECWIAKTRRNAQKEKRKEKQGKVKTERATQTEELRIRIQNAEAFKKQPAGNAPEESLLKLVNIFGNAESIFQVYSKLNEAWGGKFPNVKIGGQFSISTANQTVFFDISLTEVITAYKLLTKWEKTRILQKYNGGWVPGSKNVLVLTNLLANQQGRFLSNVMTLLGAPSWYDTSRFRSWADGSAGQAILTQAWALMKVAAAGGTMFDFEDDKMSWLQNWAAFVRWVIDARGKNLSRASRASKSKPMHLVVFKSLDESSANGSPEDVYSAGIVFTEAEVHPLSGGFIVEKSAFAPSFWEHESVKQVSTFIEAFFNRAQCKENGQSEQETIEIAEPQFDRFFVRVR